MEWQKELNALQLKAKRIVEHINKVRDYRVEYRGKLKDGTEIIIPSQGSMPRGEIGQMIWEDHVEDHVNKILGIHDFRMKYDAGYREWMSIPF